ncbi:hypothetical protein EJB05_06636, partial [Eragrostis curvula]
MGYNCLLYVFTPVSLMCSNWYLTYTPQGHESRLNLDTEGDPSNRMYTRALPVPRQLLDLPQQWRQVLTPTIILFFVPLIFFFFLARCWSSRLSKKGRLHLPPCPPGLPILGNLQQVGALPHRSLWKLARRHGPVMMLRLGRVRTVVVSSAEAAREVLMTHDADCCNRPDTPGPRRLSYDHKDVTFGPYSKHWRDRRKLFVVEFLSKRRVQATWYAREAEMEKLISRLTSAEARPVSMEDHIFEYMNSIIGTVAFGNVYVTKQFTHKKHFHDAIDEAMRVRSSFFSAEDYFPNALGRLVDCVTGVALLREKVFREFDAFYETIIEQHLNPSCAKSGKNGSLIDVLIGLMKDHQGSLTFNRDHVKAILTNTFIAGISTGSVTMVWAMAELIRNPWILKKVQDEIRTMMVQPEDLPKLKYLKMVVMETLRLHPAVPLLVPRVTLRNIKISGYDVPAKTRLFLNTWAIGRDPTNWDNPEEFNPDRFEGKDVKFDGTHFEFLPFGAGRRMCPGMAMGLATIEFTLANLLYSFNWNLPEGATVEGMSMEEAEGLTVHKKTPLMLVPTRYKWQ